MNKARKGQAVMEHLMTYGWAYLVVIVASVALFLFLTPQPFVIDEKDCLNEDGGFDDDCLQDRALFRAGVVCENLVEYIDPLEFRARAIFMLSVNYIEGQHLANSAVPPLRVSVLDDAWMYRYETDIIDSTKERILHGVECWTPATISDRNCEVKDRLGCVADNIHLKTWLNRAVIIDLEQELFGVNYDE